MRPATNRQCLILNCLRSLDRSVKAQSSGIVSDPVCLLRSINQNLRQIEHDTRAADGWNWGAK